VKTWLSVTFKHPKSTRDHFEGNTMTANKLSSVTSDLIECYGNTAKNVFDAYRAGGERVVTVLEKRWNTACKEPRSQLIKDTAKKRLCCATRLQRL
jgi:hypothetical protein